MIGRMPGLRLGAEKTLLETAILRFEMGDARLELGLAFLGGGKQGAVIASLLSSLKKLGTIGTIRARKRRKRIRGRRKRWGSRGRRGRQSGGSALRSRSNGRSWLSPFRP